MDGARNFTYFALSLSNFTFY